MIVLWNGSVSLTCLIKFDQASHKLIPNKPLLKSMKCFEHSGWIELFMLSELLVLDSVLDHFPLNPATFLCNRTLRTPRTDQQSTVSKGSSTKWVAMTVHLPTSGMQALLELAGPSMIGAARATANQQLNSMMSPRITTSTQGTPRSSNAVLQTTTSDFSWRRGTQPWTAPPSTKGNRSLALTCLWFKKSVIWQHTGLKREQ